MAVITLPGANGAYNKRRQEQINRNRKAIELIDAQQRQKATQREIDEDTRAIEALKQEGLI